MNSLLVADARSIPATTAAPANVITLRKAFEKYIRPELTKEQTGTLEAYLGALKHWETETDNPDARDVDNDVMSAFRAKLLTKAGLGPQTVMKQWRQLRAIFRRLAGRTEKNPAGRGIITDVPYFKSIKLQKVDVRTATRGQVSALYNACHVATWPKIPGITTEHIWQAAIVCWFNLGPRCWDLWGDRPGRGWEWDKFLSGGKCPTIKFKQKKCHDFTVLPLNATVVAHLERIRSDRQRVFPAHKNRGKLYEVWDAIVAEAMQTAPAIEGLKPHDLRRTCQTEMDWIRMGLGDFFLGHKAQDVGGTYYRDFARKARLAVKTLKQPKAFNALLQSLPEQPDERQRTLFQ